MNRYAPLCGPKLTLRGVISQYQIFAGERDVALCPKPALGKEGWPPSVASSGMWRVRRLFQVCAGWTEPPRR